MTSDNNASSFKYKASIIGNTENNGTKRTVKIAVPLKYLSNFWRPLEMPLILCKVELSLKWIENCMLTTAATDLKDQFIGINTKIRNAFNNNTSTDIKFPKAQINKIIQSGGFLGKLLGPLLKTRLPLIKNVIKPLAKSALIPLGLTAAASAADVGIDKKILGSGNTTLIISNEEMNDVIKIVQALEDSNILLKGVTETGKNETKIQKGGFLSMLLGTLGSSLLGNLLTGKGVVRANYGNNKEKGVVRAGRYTKLKNKMDF